MKEDSTPNESEMLLRGKNPLTVGVTRRAPLTSERP